MDWQIIIVAIVVIASVFTLLRHLKKIIKKPESACDSCSMKDQCDISNNEDKPCP